MVVSAFVIWVTIPGGDNVVIRHLPLGLFYIIAFAVIGILGLVLAGWGSANKYGIMGGLRSAAQLISYEIPVVLVAAAVAILAQSLDMPGNRRPAVNLPLPGRVAPGVLHLLHRRPGRGGTDALRHLPRRKRSRGRAVCGGTAAAHWSVFFLAEYINTFAIAALTTLLFLGGWGGPALPDVVWFLFKTYAVVRGGVLGARHFPPPAHRPADGLCLEGDGASVLLHRHNCGRCIASTACPGGGLTIMSAAGLVVAGWIIYRRMTGPARRVAEIQNRLAARQPGRRPTARVAVDAGIMSAALRGVPTMTTRTRKITVEEFEAMAADPGHRYELVDGELIDMDGTPKHGEVASEFAWQIKTHVKAAGLPLHVGNSTGFQMNPHTLRFPDVHVTTWERMAAYNPVEGAWPRFAPNVAIEVVSSSNTPAALARKTAEYFANGTQAVWIADPDPRTVAIRRPGIPEQIFDPDDMLYGDPEIPGFTCLVADIFAVLDQFERPAIS